MAFPTGTKRWAIRYVAELQDEVLRNRQNELRKERQFKQELKAKRRRLRQLYITEAITKIEYDEEAKALQTAGSVVNVADFSLSVDWKEQVTNMFEVADELLLLLQHGSPDEIQQALTGIGITLVWDGETLEFKHSTRLRRLIAFVKKGLHETADIKDGFRSKCDTARGTKYQSYRLD